MPYFATRARPNTSAPSDGSRTITLHDSQPREEGHVSPDERSGDDSSHNVGVLRLRGGPRDRPRVQWTEDVVDNEGMGKKKSKICCIYHKPKSFDESSDESSDSSDSDSDAEGACNHPHHRDNRRRRRHPRRPSDDNTDNSATGGESSTRARDAGGGTIEVMPDPEPNAYEKQPSGGKKRKKGPGPSPQDH